MSWHKCYYAHAIALVPWRKCHGMNAVARMQRRNCRGANAVAQMLRHKCCGANVTVWMLWRQCRECCGANALAWIPWYKCLAWMLWCECHGTKVVAWMPVRVGNSLFRSFTLLLKIAHFKVQPWAIHSRLQKTSNLLEKFVFFVYFWQFCSFFMPRANRSRHSFTLF